MEHIRPGALFNFTSEDSDEGIPMHACTKSMSQNRTLFCIAVQNWQTTIIAISAKDVDFLWDHHMSERIMGNYYWRMPYILSYLWNRAASEIYEQLLCNPKRPYPMKSVKCGQGGMAPRLVVPTMTICGP